MTTRHPIRTTTHEGRVCVHERAMQDGTTKRWVHIEVQPLHPTSGSPWQATRMLRKGPLSILSNFKTGEFALIPTPEDVGDDWTEGGRWTMRDRGIFEDVDEAWKVLRSELARLEKQREPIA